MREATADLILRPCRPTDDGFIFALGERVFAAYSTHPVQSLASMLGERGAQARIAEREKTPVGFFVLGLERLERDFGPWRRPAVARLNAVAVRPDMQGQGIGRFLLDRAEELARSWGAVSLSLMTAETNVPARALFESTGFAQLFRQEYAYARGQRGLVMNKPL